MALVMIGSAAVPLVALLSTAPGSVLLCAVTVHVMLPAETLSVAHRTDGDGRCAGSGLPAAFAHTWDGFGPQNRKRWSSRRALHCVVIDDNHYTCYILGCMRQAKGIANIPPHLSLQ